MYLKPTQYLWGKIESRINQMFEERLKFAADWYHYDVAKPQFDRLCMAAIIPPEVDAKIQDLGEKWFGVQDTIVVQIHNGTGFESYSMPSTATGRKGYVSPHWNHYHSSSAPKVDNDVIRNIASRRREALAKINQEKKEFLEQVKTVWDQAPSINALAKIWPPITDLLPTDIVQKLEKKSTRRTVKQLAADMDTKSLSVKILKAKVAE